MSVLSITEELETSGRGSFGEAGKRTYNRSWKVQVSSRSDRSVTIASSTLVIAAAGRIGGSYNVAGSEFDTGAILVTRDIERILDDGLWWRVSDTYDTVAENPADATATSPLDRRTRVSFRILRFEVPVEKDRDGAPVVNSAGAPFDPPATKFEPVLELTFRRNVTTYNVPLAMQYMDTVNDAEFFDIPAGQAKCEDISWSDILYENGVQYREETIVILGRTKSWQPEYLDIGMYYVIENPVSGSIARGVINDNDGNPLNQPYKLDGNGAPLADGENPVYLPFNFLEERNFGAFNITL